MRLPANRKRRGTWGTIIACAISLCLGGCLVTIISGPSEVALGEFVTYELDVASEIGGSFDITLTVLAEVPEGWTLVSNSYSGVLDGTPVSGTGTVVPGEVCGVPLGELRPGMQRIRIDAGPFPTTVDESSGTVTLEFQALAQPRGEFKIGFVFGGFDSVDVPSCSRPAYRTINRNHRLLSFLQAFFDDSDVPSLEDSLALEVSPDGQYVYSIASTEDALNLFERDLETGALTFLSSQIDGIDGVDGLGFPLDVAVSPEGSHVYVTSFNDAAIAVFEMDGGTLSYQGAFFDVPGFPLEMAIRDQFVYVTTALGVTVLERDLVTGELEHAQSLDILSASPWLVVSPDGSHVYVTREDSIAILSRAADTGMVSFLDTVFISDGPGEMAISPDGLHIYLVGDPDNSLSLYERNPMDGALVLIESWGTAEFGESLLGPKAVELSPSGAILFLASSRTVTAFARLPQGGLNLLDFEVDGDRPVTGIPNLSDIALSPDGEHLYTTSQNFGPGSVAAFIAGPAFVFTDGFESGDTAAWTSAFP